MGVGERSQRGEKTKGDRASKCSRRGAGRQGRRARMLAKINYCRVFNF